LFCVTTRLWDTAPGHPCTSSRPPHHPVATVPLPTALLPGSPEAPTLTPAITASTLIDPAQPRSPAPTLPDPTRAATRITRRSLPAITPAITPITQADTRRQTMDT
ncbi:hypothetical protein C0992_000195, partial [Termitomyces sp. T32_za158]